MPTISQLGGERTDWRATPGYNRAMETASTVLALAHGDDAASIARMSRDEIERGLDWRWRPAAIRRLITAPEVAVLCAKCRIETQVLAVGERNFLGGFGIMEYGLDRAHLVLLAVDPKLRRQGLARRLIRWLEKSARTAGISQVRLEVRADNTGARQFYVNEGFRLGDYIPGFYQGRASAYRMSKDLRP